VAARVEVVGTVFRVEVGADGATTVSVDEGRVRVIPTSGGEAVLVGAGERTRVAPVRMAATSTGPVAAAGTGTAAAAAAETDAAEPGAAADTGATVAEPVTATETAAAPAELSIDARFALAEVLSSQFKYPEAELVLRQIARDAHATVNDRARAWNWIAEREVGMEHYLDAAEIYRRAVRSGGRSQEAHLAQFALAQVYHLRLRDAARAQREYARYLEVAPDGPNAVQARAALCRLGVAEQCGGQP
jgi:tetratricopeptide (TPR) repeat protein